MTDPSFAGRLAEFRALRHAIEANVLAIATSVDGRDFTFQAPLRAARAADGRVRRAADARRSLARQVHALEVARVDSGEIRWSDESSLSTTVTTRVARGEGAILSGPRVPFHDAVVRPAAPEAVRAWLHESAPRRAILPAGELLHAPGVTLGLDAGGFNRHTLLCGQSGSGKTYALGVLIERLLLETGLRMVILDPNSDFVRLDEVRAGVDPDLAARYEDATAGVVVHRASVNWAIAARRRRCAWTRSPTARNTRSSPRCSTRRRRPNSRICTASRVPAPRR